MTSLNQRLISLENNAGTTTGTSGTITIADVENLETTLETKQDKLTAGDNINIVGNVISATGGGGGTTIDTTTDISCKTITTIGNATFGGRLISQNEKMFINNTVIDLDGLTSYNLRMNEEWLTSDFVRHSGGLFTFQNLTEVSLFIVTVLVGVESDVYNARVNWRLTPYLNNNNFSGYGQFYTTTEGSTSINRYSTLMVRTLVGASNNQVYRLTVDCKKRR